MTIVAAAALLAILVRQMFILAAIARARFFLTYAVQGRSGSAAAPTFFIVVPVLRETEHIAAMITHMQQLTESHLAHLVIVTTAREYADQHSQPPVDGGTVTLVEVLAAAGKFVHIHLHDPEGIKADQLNFAAAYCAATLLGDVTAANAFIVCYDVDSRPPLDSLEHFEAAIGAHPAADVFHQSSRFALRQSLAHNTLTERIAAGICDGGSLRANRFVLGFELPRLINRSPGTGRLKRTASSYVYAHVTGHGLCVRLSSVLKLPLPARSPLEDMHYSFQLGSRNADMVPVPSLDEAAVSSTIAAQVEQASRWFFGPARALRYLRDPATVRGPRAGFMAASALGSAAEWLGCAVVPPAILAAVMLGTDPIRAVAAAVAATYVLQLIVTELTLGADGTPIQRGLRLLTCPIATVLFGVGGFIGALTLMRGGSGIGKTERR